MRRILYCAAVLLLSQASAFDDLGVHGKEYEIAESPLVASIKKELSELDPDDLKKQVYNSVSSAFEARFRSPVCAADNYSVRQNFMYAPQDVFDVDGMKILAKGERIDVDLPKGVTEDICFVDGSDYNTSLEEIELLKQEQGCRLISISNRNVKEYEVDGFVAGRDIFPFTETIWERFDLECMPSVLHLEGKTVGVSEYRSNYLEAKGLR